MCTHFYSDCEVESYNQHDKNLDLRPTVEALSDDELDPDDESLYHRYFPPNKRDEIFDKIKSKFPEAALSFFHLDRMELFFKHNVSTDHLTPELIAEEIDMPVERLVIRKFAKDCPARPTAIWGPGSPVTSHPGGIVGRIGAFATAREGDQQVYQRRKYALTSGHGRQEGSDVFDSDGTLVGTIKKVITPQTVPPSEYDVALVELPSDYEAHNEVVDHNGILRYLNDKPCQLCEFDPLLVHKFQENAGNLTGKIEGFMQDYRESRENRPRDCIAIFNNDNNGEPFHGDGESGMLVTTLPQAPAVDNPRATIVDGLAMLVAVQPVETIDGREPRTASVAQLLKPTIRKIKTLPEFDRLKLSSQYSKRQVSDSE